MRSIQMKLEDDLVQAVDEIAKQMHTTRSAFARSALRDAIDKYMLAQLERKHREGYKNRPVGKDEFSIWEDEQEWDAAFNKSPDKLSNLAEKVRSDIREGRYRKMGFGGL